jgi:hypothetical protein
MVLEEELPEIDGGTAEIQLLTAAEELFRKAGREIAIH